MELFEKQPPEVFCKKGVLRNFAKFTGKRLCQSLFFNGVAGACKENLVFHNHWLVSFLAPIIKNDGKKSVV